MADTLAELENELKKHEDEANARLALIEEKKKQVEELKKKHEDEENTVRLQLEARKKETLDKKNEIMCQVRGVVFIGFMLQGNDIDLASFCPIQFDDKKGSPINVIVGADYDFRYITGNDEIGRWQVLRGDNGFLILVSPGRMHMYATDDEIRVLTPGNSNGRTQHSKIGYVCYYKWEEDDIVMAYAQDVAVAVGNLANIPLRPVFMQNYKYEKLDDNSVIIKGDMFQRFAITRGRPFRFDRQPICFAKKEPVRVVPETPEPRKRSRDEDTVDDDDTDDDESTVVPPTPKKADTMDPDNEHQLTIFVGESVMGKRTIHVNNQESTSGWKYAGVVIEKTVYLLKKIPIENRGSLTVISNRTKDAMSNMLTGVNAEDIPKDLVDECRTLLFSFKKLEFVCKKM